MGPGPAGLLQFQELIQRAINLSTVLAFMVLTIMIVYGGLKYLLSGGDPKAIQSASQTIFWTVGGLGFMVLAWVALKIIEAFTGVQVTNFCIGLKPFC